MNAAAAINAYNKVSTESRVLGADPHTLIAMLYEGALLEIAKARDAMVHKKTAVKGRCISKTIAIIGEGLDASLDRNVGGELAQSLGSLYEYMVRRLVEANLKNDVAILDEVARLLTDLKGAWDSIRTQLQATQPPAVAANAQRAYTAA